MTPEMIAGYPSDIRIAVENFQNLLEQLLHTSSHIYHSAIYHSAINQRSLCMIGDLVIGRYVCSTASVFSLYFFGIVSNISFKRGKPVNRWRNRRTIYYIRTVYILLQ